MKATITTKLVVCLMVMTAFVLLSGYSAQATTVTVSEDTFIRSDTPNTEEGNLDVLITGTWPQTNPMRLERTYLKFNLSSLPTGKVLTSATLWGYYYRDMAFSGGNPDLDHSLYVVGDYLNNGTTPWTEENLNWTNHSTATPTYLANWTPPADFGVWQSWEVTDAVKVEYLGDGTISIMIKGNNDETVLKSAEQFMSKEGTLDDIEGAGAFYLDITLEDAQQPPVTAPEPATLILLGLGVLALAGIRRKM